MHYDDTRPSPEELTRQFAEFQRLQANVQPMEQVEANALQNVEKWSKKLDEPELSPHDLDHLYQLAVVQMQRLLAIDIAPTDPKYAIHNRNLNASINILLTFLSRQKKPPIDRLPELLKLIDDNEAELRARFGVRAA
jgi:hypothetical protein